MPVKFDIQTDELYLEGREQGIEQGIEQHRHDTVVRGLRAGSLSLEMIANLAGVPLEYVLKVQKEIESQSKNGK
jgi:predicted transposase YdaD